MRRFFGLAFLALALATLAWEAFAYFEAGAWRVFVFGEIAFRLMPEWLNLSQAVIQRYVAAWLWDPLIQTLLLWPAWPALAAIGLTLLLWSRLGGRKRRRR